MKRLFVICSIALLCLCMPIKAYAASEGDVYAALRSIGVPEEYVSQAAGMLARGRSDGAGVYRSDGSYYSYAAMVNYIYANSETILLYCGIDPGSGGDVTAQTITSGTEETTALTAETVSETAETAASAANTAAAGEDVLSLPPEELFGLGTAPAQTETVTTAASSAAQTASESAESISTAAGTEKAEPRTGLAVSSVLLILAAVCGIGGMAWKLRADKNAEE